MINTVFLKFNRLSSSSLTCLFHWLEIFKDYKITIVCDLYNVQEDVPPPALESLLNIHDVEIINTNYQLGQDFKNCFRKKVSLCQGSANLTCYYQSTEKYFWLIDADDTMFLINNYDIIKEKLRKAETICINEELDGFSLDFYREYNTSWSFGVALLNSKVDLEKLKLIVPENIIDPLPLNLDSCFDYFRKTKIYNLKSFVFEDVAFQHLFNQFEGLDAGIYFWKNQKLWEIPLLDEIVPI